MQTYIWEFRKLRVKVGLPPSKKISFICFNESFLKMMKIIAFYFVLKALFSLKISKLLSSLFDHVEKTV